MFYLEGFICAKHSGNLISGLQSIQYEYFRGWQYTTYRKNAMKYKALHIYRVYTLLLIQTVNIAVNSNASYHVQFNTYLVT